MQLVHISQQESLINKLAIQGYNCDSYDIAKCLQIVDFDDCPNLSMIVQTDK